MNLPVITFLTDYGWSGGYVAACEALLASLAPEARVLHITHDVPLADVVEAGRVLARVAPLGPVAVHLAVVDPGVGTGRRPLVVRSRRGDLLVGPDNGLLMPAADALGGQTEAWALDPRRLRVRAGLPAGISRTFHGRDVFAPAAALLSRDPDPGPLGTRVDGDSLSRLRPPLLEYDAATVRAEVIEVDGFGNVGLALPMAELPFREGSIRVDVEGESNDPWLARPVGTFAELGPGRLGILADSWGQAGLILNGSSAAELLGVRRQSVVRLTAGPPTNEGAAS